MNVLWKLSCVPLFFSYQKEHKRDTKTKKEEKKENNKKEERNKEKVRTIGEMHIKKKQKNHPLSLFF